MMYSNKLAVAVKANGKVLREFNGDTVYVPFGTEYTILIKNLNSVRVQVRVSIDGTDATEDTALVIGPNQEMELQRFIKSGNLNEGNRFKFIERTAKIESGPRGAKIDDGLIRIEYQFEKVIPQPVITTTPWHTERWVKKEYWERQNDFWLSNATPMNSTLSSAKIGGALASLARDYDGGEPVAMAMNASFAVPQATSFSNEPASYLSNTAGSNSLRSARRLTKSSGASESKLNHTSTPNEEQNETGITVAGSISTQQFKTVSSFALEDVKHTMIVHLLGETEQGKAVSQPVTVKAKPRCTTCGHLNKATAKFCSECGTSLTIV